MLFQYQNNKIFAENDSGEIVAEITFPEVAGNKVDINHTFVHSSLRGQGIANVLMQKTIEYAQSKKLKVAASCSYAQKWFREHPEFSDLFED